jgi:hypothetical protein
MRYAINLTVGLEVSYPIISRYLLFRTVIDSTVWWTPDTAICVALGISGLLASSLPFGYIVGICWPTRPFENREKPKTRTFKHLRICLVTKGENVQTVLNTIKNWVELSSIDKRLVFHIILDQNLSPSLARGIPDFVDVILVPRNFQPPKAKYKARALEYARVAMNLGPEDWVLHLDEETQIDAYAVQTCLDFVERGDRQFGMVRFLAILYDCPAKDGPGHYILQQLFTLVFSISDCR